MENGAAYTHTFAKRNRKNVRLMAKILIAIFCGSESGLWDANLAPGSCVAYIGPFPFNYDTKNQNKGTVLRVASGQLVRVERTKVLRFLCGASACDHDSIRQAKLLTILKDFPSSLHPLFQNAATSL